MGEENQLLLIAKHSEEFQGPYLEVGSRDYGTTQDLRSLFAHKGKYVGIDLSEGKGVDIALDLTWEFDRIDTSLDHERFGSIFCLSVLEHCEQPFVMADNLTRLLKPGGKICISAPFAWKFHGYPSDYWRFTHEGIKKLFPRLSFGSHNGGAVIHKSKRLSPLDKDIGKISFTTKAHWSQGHFIRGVSAKMLRLLSGIGIFSWLAGSRYVLAPTNIFMIGSLDAERPQRPEGAEL